jgi:hypothetical protein
MYKYLIKLGNEWTLSQVEADKAAGLAMGWIPAPSDNAAIDLTKDRDVNIHAEDLPEYRFFTNSTKISYSISGALAASGKLVLERKAYYEIPELSRFSAFKSSLYLQSIPSPRAGELQQRRHGWRCRPGQGFVSARK